MPNPLLRIRDKNGERVFPLRSGPITIGRSRTNRVQVEAEGVSRTHCRLEEVDGRWRLIDMGSHNGIRVNGISVSEKWLTGEDAIEVGRALLSFHTAPPADIVAQTERETVPALAPG
ncbi:MAG: FHA domain-containing protein, partial [Planctomycetes bacterium]|nr:FHA domain-containing protein [Planctomycetota bacterium]